MYTVYFKSLKLNKIWLTIIIEEETLDHELKKIILEEETVPPTHLMEAILIITMEI